MANQVATPPIPFGSQRRDRVGRVGAPGAIADAGWDMTITSVGEDATGRGFFERQVETVTVAGAGLFEEAFQTQASAIKGVERGLRLTRLLEPGPNAADISFNISTALGAFLTSTAFGDGAPSRARGGLSFLFDGLDPDQPTCIHSTPICRRRTATRSRR